MPTTPRNLTEPDAHVEALRCVVAEIRKLLVEADEPTEADLARVQELEIRLASLLRSSAARCRSLADRLALFEEHAQEPLPEGWLGSTGAVALARRLGAAASSA